MSLWEERLSVDDATERGQINAALGAFFSKLDSGTRESSLELLSRIFPNVATYRKEGRLALGGPTRDSAEADRLKRIYHPDYFHRYFIYEVPASLYGEQEMSHFLERVTKANDRSGVAEVLDEELQLLSRVPVRRADFFDRLPVDSAKLTPEKVKFLAYSVAGVSSLLTREILGMGEQPRARAVVFAAANRFAGTSKAHDVLETVIRNAASDGFAADLLFYSVNKDRNHIIQNWNDIDEIKLQRAFEDRMKQKYSPSANMRLPQEPGSLSAFFTWSRASADGRGYFGDFAAGLNRDQNKWLLLLRGCFPAMSHTDLMCVTPHRDFSRSMNLNLSPMVWRTTCN